MKIGRPFHPARTLHQAAVLLLGVVAVACVDDAPTVRGGSALRPAAVAGVAPGDTIEFRASEFGFAPKDLVAVPGQYRGVLINDGAVEHDITFEGHDPIVAGPGQTVEFEFAVPDGGIRYWCSIPGHEDAGMAGKIAAGTGGETNDPAGSENGHSGPAEPTGVAEADPEVPAYALRDPHPPARGEGPGVTLIAGGAADGGDLIEWELVIEEQLMTVAEGFEQLVWTFGGEVPGPVLRTRVGDTVRVHLINPLDSEVSHSIDFHASQVSMEDEMDSIAPGEELIYEFTTDYAGVFMYHCGTPPVLHHIANGMYGMVIVEPTEGLPPADDELFFVQSEWYLGPQGEVTSYAAADQAAPAPDFQAFNGVASQYLDHPISIATGEDVRMFVLDAGPSIATSIHVVGAIFHRVVKEGVALEPGNEGTWGAQAVDLAPAQGAVIDFRAPEAGTFALVNHAFNFPGRGALALLSAG
ncbi:multicopper oxidase domain-containing protein [Desertimonas flava]|uniref:multicopper oxidase domain-containing protein n=1 Tax=Desertimonas flava TaxID=2064846 RepID=UPI000E348F7F|nr:multicopper oxidase domain-containing protein [Desertimonas flava]